MIIYHNLTQCTGERMVYFRSRDVEQMNWTRLLWSVPDEWLYLWSIGTRIVLVDKSTKARGKIESIFAPVLSDLMRGLYLGGRPRHRELSAHYWRARKVLKEDSSLRTKFTFWQGRIRRIDFEARTIRVEREV